MPYRKILALTIHDVLGWTKGFLVVAFAVNPLFVGVLAVLFALEVWLGTRSARETGVPVRFRDYARAKYSELVKLGSWLAIVLLVTNLDPELIHIQRYVLILTAAGLAGRIVKRHLGGDYTRMWIEMEGKILHTASREIETPEGQPNLVEQTILTEAPPPPPSTDSPSPGTVLGVVVLVSALLAACAGPILAHLAP
ncbi:MAG TPA: hypothetical protein VF594_06240 [Rubricoccaceae bacterium]|jgi:hypothetical protein